MIKSKSHHILCLILLGFVPSIWSFKLGQQFTYTFTNEVNISESLSVSQPLHYKLEGSFNVATIWRNADERLIEFRLISTKLQTLSQKSEKDFNEHKLQSSHAPFYGAFKQNTITEVFLEKNELNKVSNLKRALISFFQYQTVDGTISETDVTGTCDVSYIAWPPEKFTKTKLFCKLRDVLSNKRNNHPLGVSETIESHSNYEVADGVVQAIESLERLTFQPNAYDNVKVTINSTFNIEVNPAVGTLKTLDCKTMKECLAGLKAVEETEIVSQISPKCSDEKCYNLVAQIRQAKEYFTEEALGKSDSAGTIAGLVQAGRQAKTVEWKRILNSHTAKEIMPQLLDLLAAVQTKEAYLAVREHFKFEDTDNFNFIERYLQSLAVGIDPDDYTIEDLLRFAKKTTLDAKFEDTLAQTLASMSQHLATALDGDYKDQVVTSVLKYLLEKLENCKDDDCKLIYIRSLGNLRAPNTIKSLLTFVHEGSNRVSVEAMKSLKTFSSAYWNTDEMQNNLEKVFYQIQKPYDSSARTQALDILFQLKLSAPKLGRLVNYLAVNDTAFEVKQYLLQKLQINVSKCSHWRKAFKKILAADPKLNNYNILGQRGLSTAILRQFSTLPSFNGSLLSVQEIKDGVLKRGAADIFVEANGEKFSIFTLGMFTNGLSSFVGGKDDEDATPTAGMELVVQGTALRPLIFFNGQGELMGHVWSGTASEPTPAYQAVTLLQDYDENIRLHNGAHLEVSIHGAVSVDLKGQISMSIWNRNAVTKVTQNIGFATIVKTDFVSFANLGVEYEITEEPSLHLHSNIDFSDKIALCIQLMQPQNELRHFISKQIHIPKSNSFKSSSTVARSYKVPGYTHVLNKKNNDMCNAILT